MSVIFQSTDGFVLCHKQYLQNLYNTVQKETEVVKLSPHRHLFLVNTPYMKEEEAQKKVKDLSASNPPVRNSRKRKYGQGPLKIPSQSKVCLVKSVYEELLKRVRMLGYFSFVPSPSDILLNNRDARELSATLYRESSGWTSISFNGENNTNEALIRRIGSQEFVFPQQCKFYCQDVCEIKNYIDSLGKFDLILLDPPWWNKYIRRKKAKCEQEGYKMMYNHSLGELPLDQLLAPGGIIAVWCTNASSNLVELKEKVFPQWGVKQIAQWVWLKATQSGELVCPFSEPPGKQPFEQLIFGVRPDEINVHPRPENGKIFMSVPSAIHSHKPPISDIMQWYLPQEPRCFEIFARYLLPKWTSWGREVVKLQHCSLFQKD